MQRVLVATILGLGLGVLAHQATAAVVHDSVAEFSSIVSRQAAGVAPARSNLASMFDNSFSISATSFFSLGLSPVASPGSPAPYSTPFVSAPTASLDFFIDPHREITAGSFSEATGTLSGHAERADVYLGRSGGTEWRRIGTLHNGHGVTPAAPDGRVFNADAVVTWTVTPRVAVAGGHAYNFSFTVNSGSWNALRIVDGRASTGSGRDGFDILEFEVTSVPIPAPSPAGLFGAGLLALAAVRRRG